MSAARHRPANLLAIEKAVPAVRTGWGNMEGEKGGELGRNLLGGHSGEGPKGIPLTTIPTGFRSDQPLISAVFR